MKKFIYILSIILAGCTLTIVSCGPDETDEDEDVRAPYIGSWTCTEAGVIPLSYQVTISKDEVNSTRILIANFHYFGNTESAYAIATTNNITIPAQDICSNTVNGSGTLVNQNKISLNYYVNNHSTIDSVQADYVK